MVRMLVVLCAATPRRGSLLYKTKTVLAAMMAVLFVSVAFADGTTLTWNGADGASWTTGENWLNGETPSAWVDGANAVFPSAATVTLNGAVTVSNLTAAGAVTFAGTIVASYGNFVTPSSTLAFTGLKLSDITTIDGQMGGGNFGATPRVEAHAYHYTCDGDEATAQFQCPYGLDLRVVRIKLTEKADGIYVQTVGKSGYVSMGSSANAVNSLGCDADALGIKWNYSIATNDSDGAYGVCDLRISDSRLNLIGAASFGGTATFSNVAFNVTAPIVQTWNQQIVMRNGTLTVKGASSTKTDKTFGITDPDVSGADAAWLTATASDTVFTNMVLSRTVPVSAVMRGSYIGYEGAASIYHIKSDGQTMTFQVQHLDPRAQWIKGSLVELKQSGANVTARAIRTYLYYFTEGEDNKLGLDLEAKGSAAKPGTYSVVQYGVKSLTLQTVEVPSLTLGADNSSCIDMVADNAQIVFSAAKSQPVNLAACNGASVIYDGGTYNSGNGYMRRFESGSTLLAPANLKTEARAGFVFNASTNAIVNKNYFNELTLLNGAHIIGGGALQSGYYNVGPTSTYTSDGTGANYIETPMVLLRHNMTGNMTNTLVLATIANLNISGDIKDDSNLKGACIVKRGAATLTLSGNNTFAGRLTVEAGTVALGSDAALPASAPLTLAGGTVTCGTFANATGALTLSGDATIDLGDGSLSFADSSGETWAAGATLNITGTDSLPTRTLRFGTDSSGLTPAQLKQIRYNGGKVSLNSDGYLSGPKGLIISFL